MTFRNRPVLVTTVAVLAVALLVGGSTAVATGAAKNAAKNSVTSKSIKDNTVAGKDLKDGSVTSTDLADGSVGSTDLADGSVASGEVADNGLTGADIAEATLATVPNATTVGGVQITPLALSLPVTSGDVPVVTESGNVLSFDCGPLVTFSVSRGATSPPLLITGIHSTSDALTYPLGANESVDLQLDDGIFTVGMVMAGGGSLTVEFTGIYETNAIGSNDCFFRGTVTRTF